jgi:hypothetical protein
MKDATTDPGLPAKRMILLAKTENIDYHRFSATTGVCWVKLDDYKSLDLIKTRTEEYVTDPNVSRDINSCAMRIARDYVMRPRLANGNGPAHG